MAGSTLLVRWYRKGAGARRAPWAASQGYGRVVSGRTLAPGAAPAYTRGMGLPHGVADRLSGTTRAGVVPRRRWLAAAGLLGVPVAGLSVCRAVDLPWPETVVQLLSFTPWLVVPAGFSVLCAVAARRPVAAGAAAALLALQAAWLFSPGHARPLPPAGGRGAELVTMSINAKLGRADAGEIVRLVRDHGVGLLALQEYTPALELRLEAAGITGELPYRISAPAKDASGGALYSRFPMQSTGTLAGTRFPMASARLELPAPDGGAALLEVTNVHARAPVGGGLGQWRRELAALGRLPEQAAAAVAGRQQAGQQPPLLLLGDFNAGYDHAEFRRLVSAGAAHPLVDVATAQGARLVPTWPMDLPLPGTTLDHLLTGPSVGSRDFAVHRVAGTDHAAVVATLTIPAPG